MPVDPASPADATPFPAPNRGRRIAALAVAALLFGLLEITGFWFGVPRFIAEQAGRSGVLRLGLEGAVPLAVELAIIAILIDQFQQPVRRFGRKLVVRAGPTLSRSERFAAPLIALLVLGIVALLAVFLSQEAAFELGRLALVFIAALFVASRSRHSNYAFRGALPAALLGFLVGYFADAYVPLVTKDSDRVDCIVWSRNCPTDVPSTRQPAITQPRP